MSETPDARWKSRSGAHRHPLDSSAFRGDALDCAAVRDVAAPFALSALEPDDHESVDRHARGCAACDDHIADLRLTLSALALSVPLHAPPSSAKIDLFTRLGLPLPAGQPRPAEHAFRTVRPVYTPESVLTPRTTTPEGRTVTLPSSREDLPLLPPANSPARGIVPPAASRGGRFRPDWRLIAGPLAMAPLVLALGIVGLWGLSTQNKLSTRASEVQALNQQVNSLSQQVAALNESLDSVDNFVAQSNAKSYDMAPRSSASSEDSDAFGRVIANPGTDQAMLVVQGLDGDETLYEVLVEAPSGAMVSAGDLPVNEDGEGMTVLKLSQPFATYKSVHVKPKSIDTTVSDSIARVQPDTLFAEIDPNLGASGDTDAPDVGESN